MIRPPSNQKPYDDCYSRDPAFAPLPEKPTDEQIELRARQVRIAREQGDWSALVVEGVPPTVFTFKPLRGNVYRKLIDKGASGRIGGLELSQLAFRAALVDVSNLGIEHKIKFGLDETHDDLGPIASRDLADLIDSSDVRIIGELGGEILRRARDVSPK